MLEDGWALLRNLKCASKGSGALVAYVNVLSFAFAFALSAISELLHPALVIAPAIQVLHVASFHLLETSLALLDSRFLVSVDRSLSCIQPSGQAIRSIDT